jgi:integrase/recombinase XerD
MDFGNFLKQYSDELRLKNYGQRTIEVYVCAVSIFLRKFDQRPKDINESQIKNYLLGLSSTALVKQNIGALKLFYNLVIHQPLKFRYIEYPRQEQHLPVILSKEEVRRLFSVINNLKHKAIVSILYSTGVRVGELINLKVKDIDSGRMVIKVCEGKGKKDRYVTLSPSVLVILREYYKQFQPNDFLFYGQNSPKYSEKSIQQFLTHYATRANIQKHVHPHLLRHCFATHLLESGTDISIIQDLLGHKNPKTTQIYRHISNQFIGNLGTPFDNLNL